MPASSSARQRPPVITVDHSQARLSTAAYALLTRGGSTHVLIETQPDGSLTLRPLAFQPGAQVARILEYRPPQGPSRVFGGDLFRTFPDGPHTLEWDDASGVAKLLKPQE